MIVRDVLNTRPPELLEEWLNALGTFDVLTPHEAAAIWDVSVREALERLHAMVGGPLEIPSGHIETYRRAEWTPAATAPRPGRQGRDHVATRQTRLKSMPEAGITIAAAAEMWGITHKSAAEYLQVLVRGGFARRVRVTNRLTVFYRAGSKRRRE